MSILINQDTKVLIQGITGKEGRFWATHMKNYGTKVVAGVTPYKEGEMVDSIPVYHSVSRAVSEHDIEASLLLVPPKGCYDAVLEAIDNGIKTIVITAEGIPVHELIKIRNLVKSGSSSSIVIGGNSTGIISINQAMMGFFPYWLEHVYQPGSIGVLTRSGSLTNEINSQIVKAGKGVTSIIGVGGDAIPITRFCEILPLFEADADTKAVVMIGEIGGTMEEEVALAIENRIFTKPLIAFMGGRTAPKGKQMGHAGAIATGGKGTVESKIKVLSEVGAYIASKPSDVARIINEVIN